MFESGTETGFPASTSVFPLSESFRLCSIPSRTCCSYQKDKLSNPGNLPKSNAVPEIGKLWIEDYFDFFLVINELNVKTLSCASTQSVLCCWDWTVNHNP